jgi:hypothetical protein
VITRFRASGAAWKSATLDGSRREARLAEGGMPTERLSMRQIRETLRKKLLLGRSHWQIAESLKISAGAVGETMRRAPAAGLTDFAAVEALAPSAL